jgi:hypothetical protein
MPVDAFTISSNNYLGMARVFANSYLEHSPGAKVYVCLVDRPHPSVDYDVFPFEVIPAEDLGIPNFKNFAFRYDILELNTAVKPFVFRYLRDARGLDRALYFDPDILVHDRLLRLEQALESSQCALTPHLTQPLDNRYRPPERVIGQCGIYNLGFVGLRLDAGTEEFLDWWCDRLYRYCVVDLVHGLFVDQAWMDFAPAYLESVAVVRDRIFNIAYWNLPERFPKEVGGHWEVGGERVGFFHFSGVDIDNLDVISRHQDRIDLWRRPELRSLFQHYRELVETSGQRDLRDVPYAWDHFAGTSIRIPSCARKALQRVDPCATRWSDAFTVDGDDSFLAWLAEPLRVGTAAVNRVALGLWSSRPDVRAAFPQPLGLDIEPFVAWVLEGGGAGGDLDEVFLEPVRAARQMVAAPPPHKDLAVIAGMDLARPGGDTAWLNQLTADGGGLTRLGEVIHRSRPDVAERYSDLAGADRGGFAYWLVARGAREYGLHDDLVEPYRRQLSFKSRASLAVRTLLTRSSVRTSSVELKAPADEGPVVLPGDSSLQSTGREIRLTAPEPILGVNLVGRFDGLGANLGFAPAISSTLRAIDVPVVEVDLDLLLREGGAPDDVIHDSGVPFPISLLAVSPMQWEDVLRRLPHLTRTGAPAVGFCTECSDFVERARDLGLAEVWVPEESMAAEVARRTELPVRAVGPPMPFGSSDRAAGYSTEERQRFWFLAAHRGADGASGQACSAAIECVRSLWRRGEAKVGLRLLVGPESMGLGKELRHLPIEVVCGSSFYDDIESVAARSDAYLDLSPVPAVDPAMVCAALRNQPVIAAWWSHDLIGNGSSNASFDDAESETKARPANRVTVDEAIRAIDDVVAASGPGHERAAIISERLAASFRTVLSAAGMVRTLEDLRTRSFSERTVFVWNGDSCGWPDQRDDAASSRCGRR